MIDILAVVPSALQSNFHGRQTGGYGISTAGALMAQFSCKRKVFFVSKGTFELSQLDPSEDEFESATIPVACERMTHSREIIRGLYHLFSV